MKINTAYQEKTKEELLSLLLKKDVQILENDAQINSLTELLRIYRYRQFGNKSEKTSVDQLSIFNEDNLPKNTGAIIKADEAIHVAPHIRVKSSPGRKPLPENLPREQHIYDLSEEDKVCACGQVLTHIKDETCEQLEIVPAKIYVIQHIKKKYACKQCEETIKTAPMPAEAAATIFSLVETCKHHGIEAYDWFRYVLQRLPLCQSEAEIEALLPFNVDRNLIALPRY